ncbi:hypothetical protein Q361_1592 [Flavobacterium croceum DSM 17960]|uniref:YcxB-like protein n=1 Tax=Flavobacterium croceum DSM 17960 TaxID=1121886 RepID=A0A2S4N4F5_9FLAO|nr:hypothetical protein [Flavobacterium croceum]POS00561.1 hypothetical protein Q361_1592 [Flavobacterium croceum DSM 17960]
MENITIKSKLTFKEYFILILRIRIKSTKLFWDLLWIFLVIVILSKGNFTKDLLSLKNLLSNGYFKVIILLLYPVNIYFTYKKNFYSKQNLLNDNLTVKFQSDKIIYNSKLGDKEIENSEITEIQNINEYLIFYFREKYLIINCKFKSNLEIKKIVKNINSSIKENRTANSGFKKWRGSGFI